MAQYRVGDDVDVDLSKLRLQIGGAPAGDPAGPPQWEPATILTVRHYADGSLGYEVRVASGPHPRLTGILTADALRPRQ